MNKLPQFTAIASLQIGSKHSFGVSAYNLDNAIYPAQAVTKARNFELPVGAKSIAPITCRPPCTLLSHDEVELFKYACQQACAWCWEGGNCAYANSDWCYKNFPCPTHS